MSIFSKNIRKIRAIKKLSQSAFADLFNLTRATVGAYEEGRAEPKTETIINIARYYHISIDSLITKELTVNEILHFDALASDLNKNTNKSSVIDKKSTSLVSINYMDEYLSNIDNIEFLSKLPTIKLPFEGEFMTRAFEHSGCDMHVKESGLHHKDILFCKKINHKETKNIYENKIYVLILKNKIYVKRLYLKGNLLALESDQSNNQIDIVINDILEMWEVIGVFTRHIFIPNDLEFRILKLEDKISGLLKNKD